MQSIKYIHTLVRRNGRRVIGSFELMAENYIAVVAERDKLRRELATSRWVQEQTQRMLDQTLSALKELREAVTARHEAEAKLEEFHRERDVRLALHRAPAINETMH
jgi:hypothetical protein